jgi:tRNA dimethylallyltransferase
MATDLKTIKTPVFLVGATGTGKSAVAMEVARDSARAGVRTAVLCMDAMQVYRGADVGTSKPTAAEQAEVPHGGIDLVDFGASAHVRFDVAQYLKHAEAFLREQGEAGRRVIIVGGTGLYFRALTRGLCEAPQGSEELRAELSSLSVEQLRERLRKIDPGMVERLDASNPRRLARAIEVKEATGRSLREWQEETPEPLVGDFTAFWIQREKAELSQRIEGRVEEMFARGWVEEVRGLAERYGLEAVRSFPGIGYREIGGMLGEPDQIFKSTQLPNFEEGEATELRGQVRSQVQLGNEGKANNGSGRQARLSSPLQDGVKGDILVATRQYAKRQLTWFAREPNLREVMLTGNQSLFLAVPSLF